MRQEALDELLSDAARRFAWARTQQERLRHRLLELAARLDAEAGIPAAERRQRRQQRLAALKSVETALGRPERVLEKLPPWILEEFQDLITEDVARLLNADAFRLIGYEISGGLSQRDFDSASRYRSPGDELLRIAKGRTAAYQREVARERGLAVLVSVLRAFAERVHRELDREKLNAPDGRPADRQRQLAFAELWDVYAELTRSSLPATPPPEYLDFCVIAFPVIGVNATGMVEAAERLFTRTARQRRSAKA